MANRPALPRLGITDLNSALPFFLFGGQYPSMLVRHIRICPYTECNCIWLQHYQAMHLVSRAPSKPLEMANFLARNFERTESPIHWSASTELKHFLTKALLCLINIRSVISSAGIVITPIRSIETL